jgi:hypothetical protein
MRTSYYVHVYAYNILLPTSWRSQRDSFPIFNISNDGITMAMPNYRAERLHIDTTTMGALCIDGIDEI